MQTVGAFDSSIIIRAKNVIALANARSRSVLQAVKKIKLEIDGADCDSDPLFRLSLLLLAQCANLQSIEVHVVLPLDFG